jgi:hypothetical protein
MGTELSEARNWTKVWSILWYRLASSADLSIAKGFRQSTGFRSRFADLALSRHSESKFGEE